MPLTGLEVYKLLPKKNCGECGPPTCLAFAMQLVQGKASLDDCPYASDEAKETLGAASAPPIKEVTVGQGDFAVVEGGETVLFRHDKRFEHGTAFAIRVPDTLDADELSAELETIGKLEYERIGQILRANLVAVANESGDPKKFAETVTAVQEATDLPLVLMSESPEALKQALEIAAEGRPLIYSATEDNYEDMAALATEYECPLAVRATDLDSLAELVEKVKATGAEDLVLNPQTGTLLGNMTALTHIRRLALRKKFRPFGYPTMVVPENNEDPIEEAIEAGVYECKYGNIVVLNQPRVWQMLPLAVLRQNIYTDPQRPIQVESKIYEIGHPDENSPFYVTTNFSLSYFSVLNEIEASKVPSYLMVVDTEGTSVLTSWASGEFSAESITETLEENGAAEKVAHQTMIIPGHVAVLSGKTEELSGWKVVVGPREATGIPNWVRENWQK